MLTVVNHAFAGGENAKQLAHRLSLHAELTSEEEQKSHAFDTLMAYAKAQQAARSAHGEV